MVISEFAKNHFLFNCQIVIFGPHSLGSSKKRDVQAKTMTISELCEIDIGSQSFQPEHPSKLSERKF